MPSPNITTYKNFFSSVKYFLDCEVPYGIMLRGRHGIGKSEVVKQIAEKRKLRFIDRRLSQMTEGDLMGLPVLKTEEEMTSWYPPDWFRMACNEPCLVLADELDRGSHEVCQGFFQLGDSRALNGYELHPGTLLFTATNGGVYSQAVHYQVRELDPAELSRWMVFDLDPTVEDWLYWATGRGQVIREVVDFIRDHQNVDGNNANYLEHLGEFEPNTKYPDRRAWARLSNVLKNVEKEYGNLKETPQNKITTICGAAVGFDTAVKFNEYIQTYDRQIKVEDILTHGRFELMNGFDLKDHKLFLDKMSGENVFGRYLKKVEIGNLAQYFRMAPSEISSMLWQELLLAAQTSSDMEVKKLLESNIVNFADYEYEDGAAVKQVWASLVNNEYKDK